MCHNRATPNAVTRASTPDNPMWRPWVTMRRRRWSTRSANAPAPGPARRRGANAPVVNDPRSTPPWVSCKTNHDSATTGVMVPVAERTWLKNHCRWAGTENELKVVAKLARGPRDERAGLVRATTFTLHRGRSPPLPPQCVTAPSDGTHCGETIRETDLMTAGGSCVLYGVGRDGVAVPTETLLG